jgi:carbon starvation protein
VNGIWVLLLAFVCFAAGYRWYGRRIAGVLGVDDTRETPAHSRFDGVDYVPAKNWLVLFGHHFSSICGAGPIIGPALAVAYWGWAPSLLWVLVGCVLMGAVADFTSLMVSVRSDGSSVPEIARPEISARARLLFSWFIWLALILVIAVFAIFAARTFIEEPDTVLPSFGLIPTALLTGHLLYRTRLNHDLPLQTLTAVGSEEPNSLERNCTLGQRVAGDLLGAYFCEKGCDIGGSCPLVKSRSCLEESHHRIEFAVGSMSGTTIGGAL